MLIEALLNLVKWLFNLIMTGFEFVTFPASVASFALRFFEWLVTGVAFINSYIHTTYVYTLLAFLLALNAAVSAYHVVMWILKKIPFINIK